MLVAIIDTGIQPGVFATGPIVYDLEVTPLGIVRKRKGQIHSFHGAVVAAILEKYAPGCQICSIKIFDDETQTTTCRMLCAALRWCRHKDIPIINVSAGSVNRSDFKRIGKQINALHKNKQIVVAAYSNRGISTMPAGHKSVIGVKVSTALDGVRIILDNSHGKQDYFALSEHKLTFLWGKDLITPLSNSYATPTITAAVASLDIVPKEWSEHIG